MRLSNTGANGYVLADAIRLERLGPPSGSAFSGTSVSGQALRANAVDQTFATAYGDEEPSESLVGFYRGRKTAERPKANVR